MIETFQANVQYGDWEGTAAADGTGPYAIDDLLESKGLTTDDDFVLGVSLSVIEYFGPTAGTVIVSVYVYEGASDHDPLKRALEGMTDPIPVREIKLDLTLEEVFRLFKRFTVVLTASDMNLKGRTFRVTNDNG